MGLRKAAAYSKKKVVPYTRKSKKRQKSYIKTVPQSKIIKFDMGKGDMFRKGKLPHHLTMIVTEDVQIRHNSLEACRQFINKKINKALSGEYFFKIIPYPHHVQRENKMITGAGADRMQTGMQLAFGRTSGKAAIVKKNSKLFFVAVKNRKAVNFVRRTIHQVKAKLPCKTKITYDFRGKVI